MELEPRPTSHRAHELHHAVWLYSHTVKVSEGKENPDLGPPCPGTERSADSLPCWRVRSGVFSSQSVFKHTQTLAGQKEYKNRQYTRNISLQAQVLG